MASVSDPAVGIDLGTTNSVISHLDADGKPITILNAEGDMTTPSVVYFHESDIVVGKEALKTAAFEPELVAQFAKRDMGKSAFNRAIRGLKMPPEVIQSLVLKKLKEDAALRLGDFEKAVVTVPAYFNEPRRKATQDAGRLAGIDVIDIINEPTAAAVAYGVQMGFLDDAGETHEPETVLVYDLGGGTFDVTLMRLEGRTYHALATAGDVFLGGMDWDRKIVKYLAEQFEQEHGFDPREDLTGKQALQQEAEDAKRALTSRADTTVHYAHEGKRSRIKVTRGLFEELTESLVQRTIFTVERLLRDAKSNWDEVTRVLLVGGSTRMPMIQNALEQISGKKIDRSLSPDEAVAHGAAIYAGFLLNATEGERPNAIVTNVSSHDLGVLGVETATGRKRRQIMIARNTSLPAVGKSRFTTFRDNQASVSVNVVEGGDASGTGATSIGKCVITDLPAELPKGTPVVVGFKYMANGRLTVSAKLPDADREASMSIERTSGLTDDLIAEWQDRLENGLEFPDHESADEDHVAESDSSEQVDINDFDDDVPSESKIFGDELASDDSEEAIVESTQDYVDVDDDEGFDFLGEEDHVDEAASDTDASPPASNDDDLNDFLKGLG